MASLFSELTRSSDDSIVLTKDCDMSDTCSDDEHTEERSLKVMPEGSRSHSSLLDAIASLDTSKRQKMMQRSEATAEVSEFTFTNPEGEKTGVKLHELMGSLSNTRSHSEVKKLLSNVQRNQKVVDTPLHKHQEDKIRRTIGYEAASKEVSKWDQVVQSNRKAEQLSFPINQPVIGLQSTDQFVNKFKPSTPLEQEVYKILHGSRHNDRPNKQLTLAEEDALTSLSIEEAQERRSELQKTRALLSYYEAKCHRKKKIKSKMYHRIQRKSKAKVEGEQLNKRLQDDPEQASTLLLHLDKERAKERLTLKHRNTGKWAKGITRFGKHDQNARKLLAEQLEKSHELTKKQSQVTADEDETDDLADEPSDATPQVSLTDINNPWFMASVNNKDNDSMDQEDLISLQPVSSHVQESHNTPIQDVMNDGFEADDISCDLTEIIVKDKKETEGIGFESLDETQTHCSPLTRRDKSTPNTRDKTSTRTLSLMLATKPNTIQGAVPQLVVEEEQAMNAANQHLLNIQEAFAEDDIVQIFQDEKQEHVDRDKPKDVSLVLPGWGAWGGAGVKLGRPKHNRFLAKAKTTKLQSRRDDHLHHVVVNEKRDKKVAVHQVNQLPFPFNSPEQFQSSVRAPIGSTWNTPSTVKQLTAPKVTTKVGTVIQPITAVETFKKKGKRKRENLQRVSTDLPLNIQKVSKR
ncbi:U3 small nucleolar RNA-associated protein 14 homolog A-like [Asterias amurensis]|uniref:U3 small nucleolar RNA-associated protein 14 homolog A-like n=1 Tax=Asterias amurensis TaxID=7602 RepID=UPI003AB2BDE6